MKTQKWINVVLMGMLLASGASAAAQTTTPTTDVLGAHDLSSGTSPMHGPNANACIYCHVPHNGLSTAPLWNQTLSTKQYTLNVESTPNPTAPTTVGKESMMCLSCHDGTVAVGQTVGFGTLQMTGALTSNFGTKLESSHPFSIQPQINDAPTLVSTLASSHTTKDPAVMLIANNVECGTCHDVHNQYKDLRNPKFLVRDNTASALCFACHDTGARTVNGRDNSLVPWPTSIHATSKLQVAPKAGLGGYTTVSEVGCSSCHATHDSLGDSLIRKNPNRPLNVDDLSQGCVKCHDGSDNLAQPLMNVLSEFNAAGQYAHPFSDSSNPHAAAEPVVLNRNRHSTCADCHAPHAAQPTTAFAGTGDIRASQLGVSGVALDGTVVKTAAYQYENCLRCHGTSENKQSLPAYGYMPARLLFTGDTLDVSLQFAHGALSAHPVMRDAMNIARPSVLKYMWNIGFTLQGRAMTSRILCTDCHNGDDNREYGGSSANGVHGSKYEHILERQYVMSRVAPGALPGTPIVNVNQNPILDAVSSSPYALCAKCHDLAYINSGASWAEHTRHIQDGFSCSVCHSAHGVPAGTTGVGSGRSLLSFDLNVVGPNGNQAISYNSVSSCTLTCHGHAHQ